MPVTYVKMLFNKHKGNTVTSEFLTPVSLGRTSSVSPGVLSSVLLNKKCDEQLQAGFLWWQEEEWLASNLGGITVVFGLVWPFYVVLILIPVRGTSSGFI